MIQAVIAFERRDKRSCLAHVETAFINLRKVMQFVYERMNNPHIARAIWVRHVSGIHSWGLTLEADDPPVEYGGLSGSQSLLFLAVDAFLGIERYHSDSELKMHISGNMRDVAATFRRYSFRKLLTEKSEDDIAIENALRRMVNQLRVSKTSLSQNIYQHEKLTKNNSLLGLFIRFEQFVICQPPLLSDSP